MKKKVVLILSLIIFSFMINNKAYAYESGREVFVRHINKENGQTLENLRNANQEIINSSEVSSLMSNSNPPDAIMGGAEYYNYEVTATMEITKSLVMQYNGIKYNYLGYNVCTMPSLDEAYAIAEEKKRGVRAGTESLDKDYGNSQANAEVTTIKSNNNDVTIIDFYYTEQKVDNISPKLYSNTDVWNGNDASMTSDVTYIPAGRMLRPYFTTPKYVIKDLSYEKTLNDGKVSYKINNFVVYRMNSAYLKSSESKHVGSNGQIEITGKLVDNTDPAAAIKGIGDVYSIGINNSNQITELLNSLVNEYNNQRTTVIPGKNDIDNPDGENMVEADYDANIVIVSDAYNGLRSAKGNVVYQEYDVLSGWSGGNIEFESTNDHYINVYTPVKLNDPIVTTASNAAIDHSTVNSSSVILADDASFEIAVSLGDVDFTYYNNITAEQKNRFVNYFYFIFDFDIVHNGKTYPAGSAIRMTNRCSYDGGYTYFHGTVAPNETLTRDNSNHKVIVIASASNMDNKDLIQAIADQEEEIQVKKTKDASERKFLTDSGDNTANFSTDIALAEAHNDPAYLNGAKLYGDGYYYAMKSLTVRTASKIYDFRITDCTDLAYKSVFRVKDTIDRSNNSYYSGIRRMFVYTSGNKEYTRLEDRADININGASSTKTLPLGPYKHTTASYINAPKLGYRIAFDVKTTGYYMPTSSGEGARKVTIKPSYYYLSKDGTQLIRDITLYYKDDTDRYKRFNGSGYTLYFTPNDGYRYKNESTTSNTSYMSKKQEALTLGSESGEFTLTDKMMTLDDTGYIQSWYGEYKLPNTTIAVRTGDSIDKSLKDGYIGVKFEMSCTDIKLGQSMSYQSPNKSAASEVNTTQWDYEGYLGFSNPGQELNENTSLRLQLEKGIWIINTQELYSFVRGTVLFYDIDNKAADDIQ